MSPLCEQLLYITSWMAQNPTWERERRLIHEVCLENHEMRALILELDALEGAEGWDDDIRERIHDLFPYGPRP